MRLTFRAVPVSHFMLLLVIIICLLNNVFAAKQSIGCRDMKGKPVDWFVVYKIPKIRDVPEVYTQGLGFYYLDVNSPSWKTSPDLSIDKGGHAVYYTMQQIYNETDNDFMYLMYNDETPGGSTSESFGHTKGVVSFDYQSGFWLVHSTPHFSPERSEGYSWPGTGHTYGQSFLCISFPYSAMNDIGKQLQYNYPQIYDKNFPDKMAGSNPNMATVIHEGNDPIIKSPPWFNKVTLVSQAGNKFVSYAKFSKFGKDLYHDWLAPDLGSNLLTETWQNGAHKLYSDCTGKYSVFNVKYIEMPFPERTDIDFKETRDHSKWAITYQSDKKWVCIGDINRQEHQMYRAGGTVCFNNDAVWEEFNKIITQHEPCAEQNNQFFVQDL